MADGGKSNSTVAGGMNLSTPTTGPMGSLGLPQTSQLSGLQQFYGGFNGNGNYNMFQPQWAQILQQMNQQQQHPAQHAGNLGSMLGLLSLL